MDEMQRRLDKMIDDALSGHAASAWTSTVVPQNAPTLTYDGLMYHLAVLHQDFEEHPVAVAMRAERSTIAMIERLLPECDEREPMGFGRMRIEEDSTLPPRRVDFIDHRGRVIQRIEIE